MTHSSTVSESLAGTDDAPAERILDPRRTLPPEVAATILAVAAVLVGGLLDVPVYGVFLGWATASLALRGGIRAPVVLRCLVAGGLLGAGTLAGAAAVAPLLGATAPGWLSAVVALAIANPVLILLGRSRGFSAVPAMFIGFSTLLAIYLGGADAGPAGILVALLIGLATNLAGVGVNALGGLMTERRSRPAASPDVAALDSRLRA